MESGNGGASSKGVLVPVSPTSDTFQNKVLAPLKSAYLYEESKQFFRYKSAVLIKNTALEKKYNDFRAKRREAGYSEEDLKESYGFLLFDDANKANTLGETGVLTGNSTCTTLGDPSNGVYISMYSDCLDLNRWYHGKSGYIAIIRLTKGRVKKVSENYTQNFTVPTEGFDCHVSEQLPSVSAKTSSFLAFERTQYYMYELLNDGSSKTAQSPSAACPFAIVSFSYTDTKAALEAPQEKSDEKKSVCHYFPWRGQLQIDTHFYDVALRSTTGGSIPAELPPVVKIERATSMLDLRKLLPRAVFETCFSGEVFLDGLYCSLCELVSSEADETSSLSALLWEIKEKDVALTIPLNDGGFLILLHSSHFLRYDDTGSSASEVLQGMFVFPDSRTIYADTKSGQRKPAISSDILRVLPVLNYAEGEVEKTVIDPSEELCEVFMQHMHNYATLINPGLALSPSRDFSIFPDQYDVPDAHKHLYSSPEWTNRAWQTMRSYLNKPVSFQLPVPKVTEILAAGQEERMEDLDDDVYICLSSPEEAPANHVSMGSEDQGAEQKSSENVETFVDRCVTNAEAEGDLTEPTDVLPDDLQSGDATKDSEKSDLTVLIKTDMGTKNFLTPSTSGDMPTELIVSITSAERTVTDGSLSVISTESATKHNDFELSVFSTAKLEETAMNSLNDETAKTKKDVDCPEVNDLIQTKRRKPHRGHYKGRKHILKACMETSSLYTVTTPLEEDNMKSQKEDRAKESSGHPQLSKPPKIDWRKVRKRKRIFGKLSSKNKKVRSATVGPPVAEEKSSDHGQQSFEGTILKELESCPLRKKTERWDLKPVTSECGRILVPHGSVDFADQIKSLKDKIQSTKDEQLPEKMLVDATVNAHDTVEMEQKSSAASETAVDKTVATPSKGEGNHPNIVLRHVNLEPGILRQSYDGNGSLTSVTSEHSSTNDGTDTPPLKPVQEKHTDAPSLVKSTTKGEFLLSKLKSVLQRGKRKTGIPVLEETTANTAQEIEPCLKKGKVDSDSGILKTLDAITTVQETVLDVSKMLSVDPVFAYALGLTPKETPNKIQTSEGQDTQQKKDSSVTEEQSISDKPQIIQRPLSIFPRRSRIKTLKKHQGISAEYVKKKCAPFQVSPLSGSTRLLHHHQTMYGNGFKTLHLSVDQEDRSEYNRTPDYPKKYRRQFRLSRTFDNKDGSIQVTKQWKDNYDFNLDSKYTSDSKDRAIIRALHGPWDFSIQDTSEEVRLIVHMWIGLFYSRTTDRFFHVDSNSTNPCSEESDSLETQPSGNVAVPAQSELKTNSPSLNVTDTKDTSISKALDLSKKDNSVLDQESVILDLSLRNSNAEIVTSDPRVNKRETSLSDQQKETSETLNTPKTSMGQQKYSRKRILLTDIITKVNARSAYEKVTPPEHSDLPALKGVGPFSSAQEEIKSVSVQPKHQTVSGIGLVLHECYNEKTHVKDGIVNSEATEMSLVQKQGRDSSKSVTDKEVDPNKKGIDLLHTVEHVETQSKHMEHLEVKEKSYQEGNISPKRICTGDDSAKKESGIVSKGSLLGSEKQLSREEHKAVPLAKAENVREDVDCCTEHEDKVIKADSTGKEDGLDEKGHCFSDVEPSSALNCQLLPMMCNGPSSVKKDCISECNGQAPLDEQPPRVDNKEECHDLQLKTLCANDSGLMDERFSEIAPCAPSNMEPIPNETVVEKISENVCLADLSDQPLPMTHDDPDLEKKDCMTECNHQASLDEQPPQAGNKEDDCHDSQLRVMCAVDRALTDEHVSEKAPCASSELESISSETVTEEISENVCLAELSDQPLPMTCDGPDLEKKDCMTECNRQTPLDEQPSQADNQEVDCHDSQLRVLCAADRALTDEHVSEKAPCAPSELEPISNEPAQEISQNVCLVDLSDEPLPMTNDGPDLAKDCTMECDRQTPLDKQPPQADNKEDVCHDLLLRTICVTDGAVRDEFFSERNHYVPSEIKPIHDEPAIKEISENVGLADLSDQPLPLMNDGPDFVKKDCITDCSGQAPPLHEPLQADNKEVSSHDFQLRKLCEPVVEENKENDICLADKAHQKAKLPISDESTCLDESSADGALPQVNDSVETGGQNKLMANFSVTNDDHKDQDTSFQGEQSVDNTVRKELFYHRPHCEAEVALTKETNLNSDTTKKGLEKIHYRVVIPFIGEDISEDEVQPCESHSEHKVEKVQTTSGLTEIPFIGETTYPETVPFSLFNVSETKQPEVSGSESDDRCPTPTMDEKPYQYVSSTGPSSSSSSTTTFNGIETWKNISQKCLSKSAKSIPDEMVLDQKQSTKSTVNSDPMPHHGLHPDLELRTLRVLQSIDKFFSKSSHTNITSQIQTAEMKHSLDQISNISTKYSPTCFTPSLTSADFNDKKTSNTKPVVVSASTSQQLDTKSSGHFLISPIKSKLEDLLGVRLQLNHTDSSVNHYFEKREELQENTVGKDCYPQRSFPSTECLQAIKPNIDQDGHKTTSQTNLGHEPRSYCQRPVMAVKPSKSDEIQAEYICKDSEDSIMSKFSKDKQTKTPIVTYTTPTSMLLEKKTESLNEDKQEFSAVLDPLYLYEGRDFSKFSKIPSSSFQVQPFESAKTFSKLVDVSKNALTNSLVEAVGKTSKENNEMDQKDYLGISTLVADYKDDTVIDDGLILGPQSSLTCTVYNTRQKKSDSFLEQLSKRCLQEDPTQATLEQECLIFSEQMKQLLKKRPIHQQDACDILNLSCSSPVTVQFSSLEEQGDSMDLFIVDEPSLVGQKIKVDMSDRKQPAETTEESTSHPQKSSQRTGNPMEHAGVSGVTAECASLYTALMNDVCAVAKDPSRSKHLRTIRGGIKTEPSNHFDFCDQMKREMDESFRSNLNAIVKKSCKTKYRFYTLVTSDDTFFEETKAQLEAEGHTAVQPSEFFLSEDTSSSLLIILRNEDIAEHICEVPHLLELKKSPSVQFAGIDEPDDVVNLTHQELFMRGGFIVFDRATLETLSLSNMKKMSEILQELSRTAKWKWMLHYRDSRRIKENARLSAEAKEKKHFLNWCHEVGLLEVLPYHECDLMSKDQPDYLSCLVRLQVQNISARYPVFITDATDSAFGTNGILTMSSSSFLTCSLSETFTV